MRSKESPVLHAILWWYCLAVAIACARKSKICALAAIQVDTKVGLQLPLASNLGLKYSKPRPLSFLNIIKWQKKRKKVVKYCILNWNPLVDIIPIYLKCNKSLELDNYQSKTSYYSRFVTAILWIDEFNHANHSMFNHIFPLNEMNCKNTRPMGISMNNE